MSDPSTTLRPAASTFREPGKQRPFDLNAVRVYAAFIILFQHLISYTWIIGLTQSKLVQKGFFYVVGDPAMAIFLIFSGMTLSFGTQQVKGVRTYFRFLGDKSQRLLLPYFSIHLVGYLFLFLLPTTFPFSTMEGRHPLNLFLYPGLNVSGTAWYLYFMMVVFTFWPLLGWLTSRKGLPWLFAASVVLSVLPLPWLEVLGLGRTISHLPTLIFGAWLGIGTRGKYYWLRICGYGIVFATTLAVHYFTFEALNLRKDWLALGTITVVDLVRSIAGGLFFIQVVGLIGGRLTKARQWFTSWAVLSLDIFLLHKPFVLFPFVLGLQALHPRPVLAYALLLPVAAVAFVACGYLGKGLRRVGLLGRVFLGVPPKKARKPATKPIPAPAAGYAE